MRNRSLPEQRVGHRVQRERNDEQAHAAVRKYRAREYDRHHRMCCAHPLGDRARDRKRRPAVVHQLAEHCAEQEEREELDDEATGAGHQRLRPVREQRLARECGGDQRRQRRGEQQAEAAIGEPDDQADRNQNPDEPDKISGRHRFRSVGRSVDYEQALARVNVLRRRFTNGSFCMFGYMLI